MTSTGKNAEDARPGSGRGGRGGAKVSIKDVADLANVSIATVSRVLNTPGLVAEATARRVHEAVSHLGYRPNLFAKGLMTRRSRVLGVSIPDWSGDSYAELMRGADECAREHGYHLLVSSNAHQRPGDNLPPAFALDLVDGLIAMVTSRGGSDAEALAGLDMPVVVMSSGVEAGGLDSIEIDNYVGAHEAALHLADGTAPDRCYFVGGPISNSDAGRRASAFRDALTARGCEPRADQVNHGRWSFEWGWIWSDRLAEKGDLKGAAVLAGNDEIAVAIMHRARQAGLDVPGDVRVVGFDDSRSCPFLLPPLSSVRVPNRLLGVEAVETLIRRLEQEDAPATRTRVPTRLVIRESSQF